MKNGKDLISRGASTTRTPARPAVIFATLRGTVRIKSVCAMAKIADTKYGRVNATRRFAIEGASLAVQLPLPVSDARRRERRPLP
jgi:hypothetical protein